MAVRSRTPPGGELLWTRAPAPPVADTAPLLRRVAGRFFDWEDWLTLGLALGALLSVSLTLEDNGWTLDMPAISLVGVLGLLVALFLARSPLSALLAWPLAVVMGAAVTFWQTLVMVGPGDLEQRLTAIYDRFNTWFYLAFTGGVSNDSLPFNVLVIGLTWLGVFVFGWGLYRWHNAWLGLVPGGAALCLDLVFVGESQRESVFLYGLFAFLLVMRTHLTSRMRRWRAEGMGYPPLISLSFLHYSGWVVLFLLAIGGIVPTGPFPTPKPVEALVQQLEGVGVHFVRLAGPLRVKKIVPVHNYTSLLPFQGSIDLGERELLLVTPSDPTMHGPFILRGAVYENYESGGWRSGSRRELLPPSGVEQEVRKALLNHEMDGRLLSLTVEVDAKSVVGSVVFSPGLPVSSNVASRIEVPTASVWYVPLSIPGGGENVTDVEVLNRWAPEGTLGVSVQRDDQRRVLGIQVVSADTLPPDAVVVRPRERLMKGQLYRVMGFIPEPASEALRKAGANLPSWVRQQYLQLPSTLPARVYTLAWDVAGNEPTIYDQAKAIETYLRQYPVDYGIADTPPGQDTVDYFLFESRRGYFDYHASAMVVMLRAVGVPARLAVGFVITENDRSRDSAVYMVRDRNAYAWPEVYFPGQGWVPFNPTPDRPADLRPTQGTTGSGGSLLSEDDVIKNQPGGADIALPIGGIDVTPDKSRPGDGPGIGAGWWIALGAAAFIAALAGSAGLGWRRSVAGLPYPQQLWEKTVRLASWSGHEPRPGETPREFAGRLERAFRGARGIPDLARAYSRSRFGRHEPGAEERGRLRQAWPHLRGALLGAILRRPWRRR